MSGCTAADHAHMARALRLAERGLFTAQPNPRVGCVIARGDEILGEQMARRGEIHRAHVLRQLAKPGFDSGQIFRSGLRQAHETSLQVRMKRVEIVQP